MELKSYNKSKKFIEYANEKLVKLEERLGLKIETFSELYDNLSEDEQKEFVDLLKGADDETERNNKSKHPNTRKPKPRNKVKHGVRKKK